MSLAKWQTFIVVFMILASIFRWFQAQKGQYLTKTLYAIKSSYFSFYCLYTKWLVISKPFILWIMAFVKFELNPIFNFHWKQTEAPFLCKSKGYSLISLIFHVFIHRNNLRAITKAKLFIQGLKSALNKYFFFIIFHENSYFDNSSCFLIKRRYLLEFYY